MYPLALVLTIPLVMSTSGVTLWAAWQFAHIDSSASDSIVWGLDSFGLYVLGGTIGIVLWKFAAPVLARETWPTQRVSALIFIFTWLGAVAASTGFVVITVGTLLAGMTDLPNPHLILIVSWPVLDAIASLLPTALMSPQDWRRLKTPDASNAPSCNMTETHRVPSPHTFCFIKYGLLRALQDLLMHSPGFVLAGVYLTDDRDIVASQRTLSRVLGVSSSTINRSLRALSAEGHIQLNVSARETRITVLSRCAHSHLERSGTNDARG